MVLLRSIVVVVVRAFLQHLRRSTYLINLFTSHHTTDYHIMFLPAASTTIIDTVMIS
jgi:hypothetical protein